MIASAGYDATVRLWTNSYPEPEPIPVEVRATALAVLPGHLVVGLKVGVIVLTIKDIGQI